MLQRQSNIELLRLISMLMIMILHFHNQAVNPGILSCNHPLILETYFGHCVESICIVGVNVFVLISGYFGINFKIRGVLKLFLQCFIWGLIGYLLYCLCADTPLSWKTLAGRLMPFTHNKWWFVITYLELYFLSPVLNAAITYFDKKKHLIAILIFSFVTLYMGYCRETGEDTWGTSLSHFIYLYLIARYVGKYVNLNFIQQKRWFWFWGYIVATCITYSLAIFNTAYGRVLPCLTAYPYCSPWVILGALSLLFFALSFTFQSKVVNWLSASSLSAYLFQDGIYFGALVLYPAVASWLMPMTMGIRYALLLPLSLVFLLGTILVDRLINYVFYRPCLKVADKFIERARTRVKTKLWI